MEGLVPFILQGGDKCRLLLHPCTMANSSKTIKMTKISFFPMGKSRYMFLIGGALPCRFRGAGPSNLGLSALCLQAERWGSCPKYLLKA